MAYQWSVMTGHVIEEGIDIANANMNVSLRSSGKYEFKGVLFNNYFGRLPKTKSENVKLIKSTGKWIFSWCWSKVGNPFFQHNLIVALEMLSSRNFSYKNAGIYAHKYT